MIDRPPFDNLLSLFCFLQVGYNHWTTRMQEEARLGNQIGVDLCTEIRRWTLVQYPLVSDIGSVQDACSSHLEGFEDAYSYKLRVRLRVGFGPRPFSSSFFARVPWLLQ